MSNRGINKVILVGSLGADPETRFTANGAPITNIRIATSKSLKDKTTGEQKDHTEWHRVQFFGKLAEIADQYLKKGSLVYVEGELRTAEYEKDGIKRYSTSVMANEMQMLGGKPTSKPESIGAGNTLSKLRGDTQPSSQSPNDAFQDDEIPF